MPKFVGLGDGWLRMDVRFEYPMFYKNGRVKKRDSSNMLKLLQDAIGERYGLDDKFVMSGSWEAVDSETEKCSVELYEVKFK